MDIFQCLYCQGGEETYHTVEKIVVFPALSFTDLGVAEINSSYFFLGCCVYGFNAGYSAQDLLLLDDQEAGSSAVLMALQKSLVFVLYRAWQSLMLEKSDFFMRKNLGDKISRGPGCFSLLPKRQRFAIREMISRFFPGIQFNLEQFVMTNDVVNKAAVLGRSFVLGFNSLLGGVYVDRIKGVKIILYAKNQEMIEKHLPNTHFGQKAWHILYKYLYPYYKPEIVWLISSKKISCVLGKSFLGWTSLFSGDHGNVSVTLNSASFLEKTEK